MDPIAIIILVALIVGYFVIYRPLFILQPAKKKRALLTSFEQGMALNQQLLDNLQSFARENNLWDKPLVEGDSFRKKITELQAARDSFFSEENRLALRARNPKNLDLQLLSSSLEDQLLYHQRIAKAFGQYQTSSGNKEKTHPPSGE